MKNVDVQHPPEIFDVDQNRLVEIPFMDQNGEDLGTFWIDPAHSSQSVGELVREIVEESGLPTDNPNGSPRRYEAYRKGEKLPASMPVRDAGLDSEAPVEIYPSVVTGRVA